MADFQPLTAPTLKTDFPTAFRGYDTVKVDDWVRQMQEYLNKLIANVNNSLASIESSQNNDSQQTAALTQENERLHNQLADRDAKIEQLKTQLEQMREQADANTDGQSYMALGASAQRIIDEARRDAQNIRTKAQSDYDETMQAANKQAGHIIDDAEATRSRIANICHDNVENANKHVEVAMGAYMHMKQTLKNNLDAFENVDINQWRDLNFDPDGIVFGTSIPGAAVNQTQHTASPVNTDSTANAAPVPPAPTQPQQPQQQHSEPIAASHVEPDNPPQHSLKSNATRGSNALRFGVQNRQTQETTTPPQHDGAIVGNAVHAAVNNAADPVQQQQQPQQQSVPATPSAPPAPPAQPTAQTTQTTQSTQSQTDADRTDTSDAIRDGERGYSVRISSREDDDTPDSIQRTDAANEPVASNTDNADNTGSTDSTDNNPDPSDEYNVLNQTQGLTPNGGIA